MSSRLSFRSTALRPIDSWLSNARVGRCANVLSSCSGRFHFFCGAVCCECVHSLWLMRNFALPYGLRLLLNYNGVICWLWMCGCSLIELLPLCAPHNQRPNGILMRCRNLCDYRTIWRVFREVIVGILRWYWHFLNFHSWVRFFNLECGIQLEFAAVATHWLNFSLDFIRFYSRR